jgi:hypothetical protein
MSKNTLEVGKFAGRALIQPQTLNEEARTVEVVFATEEPVMRYSWSLDGYFREVLACTPDSVDMTRMENGAPVLNSHNRYSLEDQIGVVESARFENGQGVATLRLSSRDEVTPFFQDIKDGIIRNISVGYKVNRYEKQPMSEGENIPTFRAVSWEPMEISFVPVPADPKSGVRSENEERYQVEVSGLEPEMRTEPVNKNMENPEIQNRSAEGAGAPAPASTVATPSVEEVRAAEKKRVSEIRAVCSTAKMDDAFALRMIEEGNDVNAVRAAVIEEMSKREVKTSSVTTGADESDKRRSAMEDALTLRANPSADMSEERKSSAREFRGMRLMDMARHSLNVAGEKTTGLSEREIAESALNVRGYHSSSDFPIILGNTVNRTLRAAYAMAPQTFKPFTKQTSARDFRDITRAQLGDLTSSFKKVMEGDEYTFGSMGEAKESYKLEKFGQIIAVTWETLINDDLDAFSRVPQSIAMKAAQLESDTVWNIILNNPNMSDNVALFHASHGNLAGSAAAISVASLSTARAAMRKQKSLGGDFLNISPSFLIVGPDKELEAAQFTSSSYVATKGVDINPGFNTALSVIVEPRLTGNQWYLASAPGLIDTIEYAYLEGEGGLFTEQKTGFEVDGLQIKARLVFGAKAIDHRGLYKNAGA